MNSEIQKFFTLEKKKTNRFITLWRYKAIGIDFNEKQKRVVIRNVCINVRSIVWDNFFVWDESNKNNTEYFIYQFNISNNKNMILSQTFQFNTKSTQCTNLYLWQIDENKTRAGIAYNINSTINNMPRIKKY